jgi:hypothetical protein
MEFIFIIKVLKKNHNVPIDARLRTRDLFFHASKTFAPPPICILCFVCLFCLLFSAGVCGAAADALSEQGTLRQYLSGTGPDDAVDWEFYVTGGRGAGKWTTIPVPSHWEQHGFGTYNYGATAAANRADEHGLYRLRFNVPKSWEGRVVRLVFEGVMTDAGVRVNGESAGPAHQGAFYQFSYDISKLVKTGKDNLLEVDVAKSSANPHLDRGERHADYWVFGGIFRPVYLEAPPREFIAHAAIDARADGAMRVMVGLGAAQDKKLAWTADNMEAQVLSLDGKPEGRAAVQRIPAGGTGRLAFSMNTASPLPWSAETPNLYQLRLSLRRGDKVLHTITERFGFRTFEVRPGMGLYINGKRVVLKGASRHGFRPDTGRALTRENNYEDARLIKEMNMNAVRLSHYPPDKAFLEACDELGLYVLHELASWQHPLDTGTGRRLVRELVQRDVNHPSVLFWSNGNEGGWNRELDGDFALHDPQNRPVLHPWQLFNDIDTKHYPNYEDLTGRLAGRHLVMPTEFLHGLFDGGAGAGLEDYWRAIARSPVGAGGFIWVLADEGIARTDRNGALDVYSTNAPDGIVGPRHEKDGSFYAIRETWSPLLVDEPKLDSRFDGTLKIRNHYDILSTDGCRLEWALVDFGGGGRVGPRMRVVAGGAVAMPLIHAGSTGGARLPLPRDWAEADALQVAVFGANKQELWRWTWPTPRLGKRFADGGLRKGSDAPRQELMGNEIHLSANGVLASIDAGTGRLRRIEAAGKIYPLSDGPRLAFARPRTGAKNEVEWLDASEPKKGADPLIWKLNHPGMANFVEIPFEGVGRWEWGGFCLEIFNGKSWRVVHDFSRQSRDGNRYEFPPQIIEAARLSKLTSSKGTPVELKSVRIGWEPGRFPEVGKAVVTHGRGIDPESGIPGAWVESKGRDGLQTRWTMLPDGSLRMNYTYKLEGEFIYHGVTLDHPETDMVSMRWLGLGPNRVWQNRMRGAWLDVHEVARRDFQPGVEWPYPQFQGYFGGVQWARLETGAGPVFINSLSSTGYLRVGTPKVDFPKNYTDFPSGDISFLHAIPAIGSKFHRPEKRGPSGRPARAGGIYKGAILFDFGTR